MSITLMDEMEKPPQQTLLAEAVARELPFLPPGEADAEIVKLHIQVGDLEEKNGELARQNKGLEDRNAELERVIKAMCRGCALRITGSCDWVCRGRDYNNTEDLRPVDLTARQEILCGQA